MVDINQIPTHTLLNIIRERQVTKESNPQEDVLNSRLNTLSEDDKTTIKNAKSINSLESKSKTTLLDICNDYLLNLNRYEWKFFLNILFYLHI